MKKLTIILMALLFVFGVTAGISISNYIKKDVELNKADNELFKEINITGYSLAPIECNSKTCNPIRFKIDGVVDKTISLQPYHTECVEYDKTGLECIREEDIYFTDAELSKQRDEWENNIRNKALNYLKEKKKAKQIMEKKVEGVEVTLTEKK